MDTIAPPQQPVAAARHPRRSGLVRFWRWLTRMRTAVIMLFVLAAASSVGSFLPQRPVNELAVLRWKALRPVLGDTFEMLGLFDVYGAPWFMAIYLLIVVSLVGCLTKRYRAFLRVVRSAPKPGGSASQSFTGVTGLSPDDARSRVRSLLRKRRWRIAETEGVVAAEKGRWREGGSLIFHTSLLLLILAVGVGRGFGFQGQVAIVEGERFFDTHVAYDSIREGSLFNERHREFALQVDDFNVTFRSDGTAKEFVSRVKLYQGEDLIKDSDIRVNNPLVHRGVSIFQLAWGWAPRIVVTQKGKVLSDRHVVFLPERGGWRGVAKIPGTTPKQTGFEMFFFPDMILEEDGTPRNLSPEPNRPVVFFQQFIGDLGLGVPQSVYQLDKRGLVEAEARAIRLGNTATLADDIQISFPELKQYTVFQIAADPGQPIALGAAACILVGLIPGLYSSRRRVWIRFSNAGDETRVSVEGSAMQRKGAFEQEFAALVRDMGRNLSEKKER